MPLNWDISKVSEYEELYTPSDREGYVRLKHVPDTIITLTMAVGMRDITDTNWERFYGRVRFLERIHGAFFFNDERQPVYITEEDIKRMIGLHTNASTLTKAQFLKRHTQSLNL